MSQQQDFRNLDLVGDFIVASREIDTIRIAIVTGRDGIMPKIENMPQASAIAFCDAAIKENQKTIDGKGTSSTDMAIARNRLPALKTAMKQLKALGPL